MGLFLKDIGVDFGSDNLRIATKNDGIVFNEPSLIILDKETGKVISFGKKSLNMKGRVPDDVLIVKPIVRGEVIDKRNAILLLKLAIKKAFGLTLTKPDFIISLNTNVKDIERKVFFEVCKEAGASKVYPVYDTIAAYVGAGSNITDVKGKFLIDIGAEKTDIAILSFGSMYKSKFVPLGGKDIDDNLIEYLQDKYKVRIGSVSAELLKIALHSISKESSVITKNVRGIDVKTNLPRTISVSTNDLIEASEPIIKKIASACAEVFKYAPPEIIADIIKSNIIIVGGTSNLNGVKEILYEKIGVNAFVLEDSPENAVIRGIIRIMQTGSLDLHKKILISI